jgi:cytoskeletal protein CcmA (bactofilin family)
MLNRKESVTNNGYTHNLVAAGTKITGNLNTESDIRIDGEVQGDLHCSNKIIVGTTGSILGKINCINADIMGKVEGIINASEKVSLTSTADLKGDIITKIISIEPGAIFYGNCKAGGEQISKISDILL